MKRSNQNPTTIEATLDDLYANELNVELSWDHKRGFLAVLGNPPLAKKTFPTSGEAVSWLKEQALRHFTRAEFRARRCGRRRPRGNPRPSLREPHRRLDFVGLGWRLLRRYRRAETGREILRRQRWRSNRLAARSGDPPLSRQRIRPPICRVRRLGRPDRSRPRRRGAGLMRMLIMPVRSTVRSDMIGR